MMIATRIFSSKAQALRRFAPIGGSRFLSTKAAPIDDAPSASDIQHLQGLFKTDPDSAVMVFSSTSKLTSGLRSTATIRDQFHILADEPAAIGGTDTAPNPVEILLAALGSCQEITFKAYAQAMEIPLTSVSSQLDGEIDLKGFFAVDPNVRPGFQKITGVVTIETPASVSLDQVTQLKQAVDAHCPVKDMLGNVPMSIALKHVQA